MKKNNDGFLNLFKQMMKFSIVGIIAFFIDYAVLILLTELLDVWYFASSFIAYVASFLFNFYASMRFVFAGKSGQTRRKQFLIFVVIAAIALAINQVIMWLSVEEMGLNYIVGQILATVVVMMWNFFARKKTLED